MKLQLLDWPWWERTAIVSDAVEEEMRADLSAEELAIMRTLPNERRRIEWAAARFAVKSLLELEGISRHEVRVERAGGQPRAIVRGSEWPGAVSISHSRGVAAGVISSGAVGIDIQDVRRIDERASKFFLRPGEEELLRSLALDGRIIHLWAAKEAAWKAATPPGGLLKSIGMELTGERSEGLSLSYEAGGRTGRIETTRYDDRFVLALARER